MRKIFITLFFFSFLSQPLLAQTLKDIYYKCDRVAADYSAMAGRLKIKGCWDTRFSTDFECSEIKAEKNRYASKFSEYDCLDHAERAKKYCICNSESDCKSTAEEVREEVSRTKFYSCIFAESYFKYSYKSISKYIIGFLSSVTVKSLIEDIPVDDSKNPSDIKIQDYKQQKEVIKPEGTST